MAWRQLNKLTVKTQACLPSIEDLFDSVRGAKYFSKLDLKSGYNQVRVEERDIPKTAINTPFGHFEFTYTVMGFGLTNAPATFMSLMNHVLRPFWRKFAVVFLDDILVFSRTWKEHLDHLNAVLSALHDQSLFCNIAKCEFALESVRILGHIVDGIRLRPDPEKIMVHGPRLEGTQFCHRSQAVPRVYKLFSPIYRRLFFHCLAIEGADR